MSTMSGRSSLGEFQDRPLSSPPEPQRLLKTLLEALAFLESAHEGDLETVRNSTVDEAIKRTVIRRLEDSHRRRRAPYLRQIGELEACMRVTTT
jgi:hypothetical protein